MLNGIEGVNCKSKADEWLRNKCDVEKNWKVFVKCFEGILFLAMGVKL